MGRKKVEEQSDFQQNEFLDVDSDFEIDDSVSYDEGTIIENNNVKPTISDAYKKDTKERKKVLVNCLRNERIIVRHIPKESHYVKNPKHLLYGSMAESAQRTFVVPRLSSGIFKNILTDNEKEYLEHIMGFEHNTMSVYKKVDNFWDSSNEFGINSVTLKKQDNYFDLSSPEDYIRYKILLTNKNLIAPSLREMMDNPKATYQFVITSDKEENNLSKTKLDIKMSCYKEYGKVEDDIEILRTIVETIDSRPLAPNTKLEFLQSRIDKFITTMPEIFHETITDPLLKTKTLLRKAISKGFIANKGGYLYLKETNTPLCEDGQNPTLAIAAEYLNAPQRQDVLFSLQAKVK